MSGRPPRAHRLPRPTMLVGSLVLIACIAAMVLRLEAWPLSSYPMYANYRRPAGLRAYRVQVQHGGDQHFVDWRPRDHKERYRLSLHFEALLAGAQGAPDPRASLTAEAALIAYFDRVGAIDQGGRRADRARLLERHVVDDDCQRIDDQVVCEIAITPPQENGA